MKGLPRTRPWHVNNNWSQIPISRTLIGQIVRQPITCPLLYACLFVHAHHHYFPLAIRVFLVKTTFHQPLYLEPSGSSSLLSFFFKVPTLLSVQVGSHTFACTRQLMDGYPTPDFCRWGRGGVSVHFLGVRRFPILTPFSPPLILSSYPFLRPWIGFKSRSCELQRVQSKSSTHPPIDPFRQCTFNCLVIQSCLTQSNPTCNVADQANNRPARPSDLTHPRVRGIKVGAAPDSPLSPSLPFIFLHIAYTDIVGHRFYELQGLDRASIRDKGRVE